MGNCFRPFGLMRRCSSRLAQKKIVLLLVGLDNAGKSSAAKSLSKDAVENVTPTVGFNVVKLYHKGYTVIIYDLGGGAQIRDIWTRYFADVHGVIFVVDASDRERLDECKKVFEELLASESLSGKPVLLLANKQDKTGALDELDIVEKLNVESLVNMQHCPTLVETCAAAAPVENGKKRKLDPGIENGYRWLLRRIIKEYDHLNKRVLADQEVQRVALEKEKAERKERIERMKEMENGSNGESEDEEEEVSSPHPSNPFQPIQVLVKEIENKEKRKSVINNGNVVNKNSDEVIDIEYYKNDDNSSEPVLTAVDGVREQLRQKSASQRKKRQLLRKNNRTAPSNGDTQVPETCTSPSELKQLSALPPIRHKGSALSWAHVANGKPQNGYAWELEKSLEVVLPPQVDNRPQSGGSDADDVITALR